MATRFSKFDKKFKDHKLAVGNVTKNFWDVLMANYYFWPFVNFLNFKYIPMDFRMVCVNICAVFWNAYLAWKNQKDKKQHKELAFDKAREALKMGS